MTPFFGEGTSKVSNLQSFILASLLLLSTSALGAYNEVFDENGQMRPHYVEYQRRTKTQIYPVTEQTLQTLMNKPLNDAIKILPIPAILSVNDYEKLQTGALQRQRALSAFFLDVVLKKGEQLRRSRKFNLAQIQHILRIIPPHYSLDFLHSVWKDKKLKDLRYFIGSDVVRNEHGEFVVLEDNVGLLGGLGDVTATQKVFDQKVLSEQKEYQTPLETAILEFLKDIPREKWSEDVVAVYDLGDPKPGILPKDNEGMREMEVLKKLGLNVVSSEHIASIEFKMNFYKPGTKRKIVNLQHVSSFDIDHNAHYLLANEFKLGHVDLMFSPGTEILTSKRLLPLVDMFIEFYLKEKPILKTQPTAPLQSNEPEDGWVIKDAEGSQGTGVYVMDHLTDLGKERLFDLTLDSFSSDRLMHSFPRVTYVKQKFVDPSFIPAEAGSWVKFNVDFRPLIIVQGETTPAPVIWGRANLKLPGYLNNVSQGAFELVIKTPDGDCERKLLQPQI